MSACAIEVLVQVGEYIAAGALGALAVALAYALFAWWDGKRK